MRKTLGLAAIVVAGHLFSAVPPLTADIANRQGVGDKAAEEREVLAAQRPDDPESWYTLAKYYSDRAQNDGNLPIDVAKKYVRRGLEAGERALAINPVYYEALRLKDVLLRQWAPHEEDVAVQNKLIAEAVAATALAEELLRQQAAQRRGR